MDFTSKEYSKNVCKEIGIHEDKWGYINDACCDAYWQGYNDAMKAIKKERRAELDRLLEEIRGGHKVVSS